MCALFAKQATYYLALILCWAWQTEWNKL